LIENINSLKEQRDFVIKNNELFSFYVAYDSFTERLLPHKLKVNKLKLSFISRHLHHQQ